MTHKITNGVDRSSLKLTLQIKDSQYSIKGSNSNSEEGSEHDSLDESAMTDSTIESSLNFFGAENSDELSNANSEDLSNTNSEELSNTISSMPDCQTYNENDTDHEIAEPTSNNLFPEINSIKSCAKEVEEKRAESPPIVIKKEKENGDSESKDESDLQKSEQASDGEKSSENGDNSISKGGESDEQLSEPETEAAPDETMSKPAAPPPPQPLISVRKAEDLMMSRTQVNGSGGGEECSICCERFGSPSALEQHRATAGHYTCTMSDDCSNSIFHSANELNQHQAMHHQPPVQQLAQQVQRIPATFTSPSYRAQTPPQQRNVYMQSPSMVPYYHGAMMQHEGSGMQQIGSGVVLSPVAPPQPPQAQQQQQHQQVPNLPPGIQLSKRPAVQQPEVTPPKQRREEEPRPGIRLPDSITLVSRTPPQPQPRRTDSVTDMLANRGITVVPSGRPNTSQAPSTSSLPKSLMNTSAISITPSSQPQQQQSQQQHRSSNFAVPAPKQPVSRLLTVDLTKESDAPPRRAMARGGRVRGPTARQICQICDKAFPTQQELQQHMACHRGAPTKLPFECQVCGAQYPSEAALQAHRQKYHGVSGPSPDMAIPVVDLKQVGVMSRLAALGIRSVIPLSQLHSGSGSGGMFGLPVVAVAAASNPAICNIGGLGASNLLPLGPLKNFSFNNNMR